jgi:glycosyltransferase involved in cell wall biosynthesis
MSTELPISDPGKLLPPDALRVCIVAENASFRFGGEASLPLHYFSRLRARGIEAWLIIHGRTKPELQALLPADQDRIRYIADSWYHKLIWRLSGLVPRRIAEATFGILMVLIDHLIQRGMIKRLIRQCGVNIVHQPIPVSPKAPSFIFGFDIPVIIGPMNGGMDYPAAFRGSESLCTRIAVIIGRASANFVNSIITGKTRASVLLVANERTRNALPSGTRGKIIEIAENAVDFTVWSLPPKAMPSAVPPRFLFVGRLVDWKRLDLVLRALAEVPEAQLDVIGDGQMRITWTALARHLGIADRVRWLGWLSQAQCAQHMHGAMALLLPSIYECGGAVVLEAMACGRPVVVTAWGGPTDYVDGSCGILVDPASSDAIVSGFVDAIRKLVTNPALRMQLGTAGRKRVELLYDWNSKIDRIVEIYRKCIFEHRS